MSKGHHSGESKVKLWIAYANTEVVEMIYQPEQSRYVLNFQSGTVHQRVIMNLSELMLLCEMLPLVDVFKKTQSEKDQDTKS